METARINEMLMMKITVIREIVDSLEPKDLSRLASDIRNLETAVAELKDVMVALPHR